MNFSRHDLPGELLVRIYSELVKPRLIEEKMLILLRQGKVSKWFSGIGQEAIAVGATLALESDEFILPMHRNLGVFTARNLPLQKLFAQWQGKASGYTKGRDRSFHFGSVENHIVGMISHLAAQCAVADGISLAQKLEKSGKATLVFIGEGSTSEGDFHEALNVAAVWDLPVIFLVENNGYGLSTPVSEQFNIKDIADKGKGYGVSSKVIDGNNVLEVYMTVSGIARRMRKNPKPYLLECKTFRRRGHEEASGVKYVPKELIESWEKKDPVDLFEEYLLKEKHLDNKTIQEIKNAFASEIDAALELVFKEPDVKFTLENELADIYRPANTEVSTPSGSKIEMRFIDAISDGLKQSLERYDNLVLMGQDIADYGGDFKITEGFVDLFGKERIRNTPICESAIIGAGLGMSVKGWKSVIEMQFADFVSCGFNQIVNNLAKVHYRWGQNADVVIRMPTGAGVNAGPFHSQSNEAWFFHVPGLKIVYPAFPNDAKGLLIAAIEDPNPVLFFEHKKLYRSIKDEVNEAYFSVPIGKAFPVKEGDDLSIITYGMGVHWALDAVNELGISADIIDLRTLLPWDKETTMQSVLKTGKVLVLHEDTLTGGISGEIAAWISEHCFESLDAPVKRIGSLDTPVPMAPDLENNFLASSRLKEALQELISY